MKGDRLDPELIRRKLGLLEAHAVKRKLPYANVCRRWFRPNPPLDESDVRRFESDLGVRLPEDYREFLLKVGNGGGGGLFPLGCDSEGASYQQAMEQWRDGSYRVYMYGGKLLDRAFPHTRASKPANTEGTDAADHREDDVRGSMRIYHCGCAIYNILVISGRERGNIWCDSRADGQGIYPECPPGGGRLTFARWYLIVLDKLMRFHDIVPER
jgi:hypothetical protein